MPPRPDESAAAARRHAAVTWTSLPEHLGITVTVGEVPAELSEAEHPAPFIETTTTETLVHLVGGNALYVRGGRDITVHVPEDVRDTGDHGWLVQGWGVAAAMAQRGVLTLHAAAVEIDGCAVLVAGESGAGKSTTALGLRARGHRLLVDDVCALELPESPDIANVLPYLRGVHVARPTAHLLELDFDALPHLSSARGKATFFAEDPGASPMPVSTVVVLARGEVGAVTTKTLRGAERVGALHPHARREGLGPAVMGRERYFELLSRLAARVTAVQVTRPMGEDSLDQVLDAVEQAADDCVRMGV